MILPPPPTPAPAPDPVDRLLGLLGPPPCPGPVLDPLLCLFPSLYRLLGADAILAVLQRTGTQSRRQRRLPAHDVVWLVIAGSLFRDRSLPLVWRHLHPSSDAAEPADSSFTQARQRLGALPLQLLFHRTCRPVAEEGLAGVFHGCWLLVALDGTVLEAPDTPENRRVLGAASNQHGAAAFPQLRLAALCEVGCHAVTDVEMGPYHASEQALSLRLLRRLPAGRLVLMDRGLSYYGLVAALRRRKSHVLARVKARQRELAVERVLPDGSYLSTIYPGHNQRRARRGGIRVRVIRYTHDDPRRDGCGEESVLITTVLDGKALTARQAVLLYPWRWEEESVFAEIKETMLKNAQPLLRSKEPTLVVQEVYGLLIGHYLLRRVMAQAARAAAAAAVRLSFKHSLEILEDRMKDEADDRWRAGLCREVSRQKLRPKRLRRQPRVKKATRSRWPNKKPGAKPPPQPTKPFDKVLRLRHDGHLFGGKKFLHFSGAGTQLDELEQLILKGVALIQNEKTPWREFSHVNPFGKKVRIICNRNLRVQECVNLFAVGAVACRKFRTDGLAAQPGSAIFKILAGIFAGGLERNCGLEQRGKAVDIGLQLILKQFLGNQIIRALAAR